MPMHPEAKPRFGAFPVSFRLFILIALWKNSREGGGFLPCGGEPFYVILRAVSGGKSGFLFSEKAESPSA
jgi:hypothetical protein